MAWLRQHTDAASVFTVGFCFGGSNSWAQSAADHALDGCMGFYGVPSRVESPRAADAGAAFADQVRATGTSVDMAVFDGMPHSFFDRSFVEHEAACDRAWREMLTFVEAHSD